VRSVRSSIFYFRWAALVSLPIRPHIFSSVAAFW
jgi:hypothetical protein